MKVKTFSTKTSLLRNLFKTGVVLGMLLLVVGIGWFIRLTEQAAKQREMRTEIARFRSEPDPDALRKLQELAAGVPDMEISFEALEYQVLYQRWWNVLKQFDRLLAASGNKYLSQGLEDLTSKTRKDLLDLRETCSRFLRDRPGKDVSSDSWKTYNLRGCLSVIAAYMSLEFEEDVRQSGKFLDDAIEDFKAALDHAEKKSASIYMRALPAWNLELIVGAGEHMVAGRQSMEENLAKVREHLKPTMPSLGGYSPGAPLETRVRK